MKKMKIMKRILFICLLLTTLIGCSSRPNKVLDPMEEQFLTFISTTDMNESLELKVDSDQNTFPLGLKIPVIIYNKSAHFILLTGDSYVKLFTIKDDEWVEVTSELTYSGSTVLSPEGTLLLDQAYTWAQPAPDETLMNTGQKDLPIRIVVTGEVIENDVPTGKFVGAYVDIHIRP